MKKLLSICLVIVMLITTIPVGAFEFKVSAETEGYYTYSVSNGKATITDFDESISGSVTLASTLGGYPVIGIGDYAFAYCSSLESITIPEGIKNIGDWAFSSCTRLISITIPKSLTTIGDVSFYNCISLEHIAIPNSVTSIGESAFNNCKSLKNITIPDSVTSIGRYAFAYTGYYNNAANWENNVLYIDKHLICVADISESYNIKDGTLTISGAAFQYRDSLTNVTIPNSVKCIDNYAFYMCESLENVYYRGSGEDKAKISIGSYNSNLTGATWYYNSCIGSVAHTFGDDAVCDVCGQKDFVLGDIDGTGEVDIDDVAVLAKYLAGWKVDCNQATLDVSGDGVVNLFDLVRLSQHVAGWDVTLY